MKRTLYLIDTINDKRISSSLHIEELIPYIAELGNMEVVSLNLDLNNLNSAIQEVNDKADIVFIVHDFTLWNKGSIDIDYGLFTKFICSLWNNKNIFVFPTELAFSGLIKSQFKMNAPLITKIIVASEAFRKIFIKVDSGFGVPANKIKLINIPAKTFQLVDNTKEKTKLNIREKIVLIPGLLHPNKDYIQILKDLIPLTKKYKYIKLIFNFKNHTTAKFQTISDQFEKIQDFIEDNKLNEYVTLVLNEPKNNYFYILSLADLVVFPNDSSLDMYNGAIIDALGMGKAIVAPESLFAEDLVKKSGILLYKHMNELSFYDACSVILENKEFRSILEQQNHEYGQTLSYNTIAQQYVNQIKRFKFSN